MKSYREVLETFPDTKEGEADAWDAARKYAKLLVSQSAQGRLAIGVRRTRNEANQSVFAVVVVERKDSKSPT